MKVRIKEKLYHNGRKFYFVEIKRFLFWHAVHYADDRLSYKIKSFWTLSDAEEAVERIINDVLSRKLKSVKIVNTYNVIPAKPQSKQDIDCEYGGDCKRCKYFVDEGRYPKGYCEHLNSNVYAE